MPRFLYYMAWVQERNCGTKLYYLRSPLQQPLESHFQAEYKECKKLGFSLENEDLRWGETLNKQLEEHSTQGISLKSYYWTELRAIHTQTLGNFKQFQTKAFCKTVAEDNMFFVSDHLLQEMKIIQVSCLV